MDYKIIALDMDDTLLKENLTIGKRTKEALSEAKKRGLIIVLASGRPTEALEKYAIELELNISNGYILSYNGSFVKNCVNNDVIYKQSLTNEKIHKIFDLAEKHKLYIHTYMDNYIIVNKQNEYTDFESKITGIPVKVVNNFKEYVNCDVVKAIALEEPTYLNKAKEKIIKEVGEIMSVTTSKPFFLEFMDKGVDKGKALELLAKNIGIDMKEVIAVGDSYNDITMMKSAGLSVAMGNANDEVKKIANTIVSDNENDGVAEAIEKYILKGE